MIKFDGINPQAYDASVAVEPDFKAMIGAAREPLRQVLMANIRSIPFPQRMVAKILWWPILKIVLPLILQLIIEMFMQRKGMVAEQECSKPLQAALTGKGIQEWDRM
jgi:hypothetical protein